MSTLMALPCSPTTFSPAEDLPPAPARRLRACDLVAGLAPVVPAPRFAHWRVLGELDGERVLKSRDGRLAIEKEHAVLVEMTPEQARRWKGALRLKRGPFPAW